VSFFTGVGGAVTGRGGHVLIGDDLIKNREDADSQAMRDKAWAWFNQVFRSRVMDDAAAYMLIATRWHEDDVIGRITDPSNPHYNAEEAALWTVINLPAIAMSDDPLERKPGEVLWPERFGKDFLESAQRADPRGFASLYQGNPSVIGGNLFKRDWIKLYKPGQLPSSLRMYLATDLAVSSEQENDRSCVIPFGIDANQEVWIMADVWWMRAPADQVVEQLIRMILRHEPIYLFGEKGIIAKSIGPFLRKRMAEAQAYTTIDETHPKTDKQARAMSILGRMAQGKVHFPAGAPWLQGAIEELLKFPRGARDDFVDAMSMIGLALTKLAPASNKTTVPATRPGTFGYMKAIEKRESRIIRLNRGRAGW
jgi:predicted phage terminase large subunit-like protein